MKANLKNEKFFLSLVSKGLLRITKSGRAFNTRSGRELALTATSGGYRKLSWQHPITKKIVQVQLHRIVWAVFKGLPAEESDQVNHLDGDKTNCCLSNLELTDNSGNGKHAHATGLQPSCKGERNSQAAFSDTSVFRLRKGFATERVTFESIVRRYKVHDLTVRQMLLGNTYPHVVSGYEQECARILRESFKKRGIADSDIRKIQILRGKGLSSYAISERTGFSRNTVMKYWD